MGLHDRLSQKSEGAAQVPGGAHAPLAPLVDPYAELKAAVHHACIAKLGPEIFTQDPTELDRARVPRGDRGARAREHAAHARGASRARPPAHRRHPRLRPARTAARRRHRHGGHGQRPDQVYVERAGKLERTPAALRRRRAPDAHHRQDRLAGRPPHRRVVADGRRPPAGRQPRQRDHPAARSHRPDADDPQVRARAVHDQRPDLVRHASRRAPRSSSARASRES